MYKCNMWCASRLYIRTNFMYVNDMHRVSSLMKCIIFADDTNFLYTGNDISEICKTVSKELDKLSSWFMANKLSLNVSKTNFMVISRKQIVNKPIVSINSITIERVYITKFLGVHIDCQLDWNCHIKSIKKKLLRMCRSWIESSTCWIVMRYIRCTPLL